MVTAKEKRLRTELINTGRKLYNFSLVAGCSGNLSARIDENNILVTATGRSLGSLKQKDIIKVNLNKEESLSNLKLTREFPLHALIYKESSQKVVIHCHPPLANGYFAVCPELKMLTFETKIYLGAMKVVTQDTPQISKPELVLQALKESNIAVIKNHGVVSVAKEFSGALYLIETIEEAIKTAAVARLFKGEPLDTNFI